MKRLTAGSEIDAWCTKCRMDLGHRIVAMVAERPKRVVCLTCGSQHNYRPTRPERQEARAKSPRPASAPRAKKPTQKALAELDRVAEWESRVGGKASDAFARYAMDATFGKDDLVLHRKFGEGYVLDVLDGKVSIMFRDGPRTLAQGKS
jgi:hypothetical protein